MCLQLQPCSPTEPEKNLPLIHHNHTISIHLQALLRPYMRATLETLGAAVTRFTRRNLRLLYDVLDTMAEAMGDVVCDPQVCRCLQSSCRQPRCMWWKLCGILHVHAHLR